MVATRAVLGTIVGALAVTAAFAVPAIGAPDAARRLVARAGNPTSFFTPASADPKLTALIARSGLGAAPFRFTPADSRGAQRRVADIALPVTAPKAVVTLRGAPTALPVGVAPFAYDLGTTAQKRPVIDSDVKFDLAATKQPGKTMDLGTTPSGRRASNKFRSTAEKPSDANSRLTSDVPNYSIDVGGSYSLNKNIDVTAGVRYKAQDRERLSRLSDDARKDSQAVYVGTAFRF